MKTNLKKILVLLLALISIAAMLTLTACGGGDDDDDDYDPYSSVKLTVYNVSDDPNESVEIWAGKSAPDWVWDYTRPGYTFLGLYDSMTGGVQVVDQSGCTMFDLEQDCTLYAHWELCEYTITLEVATDRGFLSPSDSTFKVTVKDTLTYLPVPEVREGYEFLGWWSNGFQRYLTNEEGEVLEEYRSAAGADFIWLNNLTLNAMITEIHYDVTLDYNNESGIKETLSFKAGEKIENLPTPENDYVNQIEFIGWSTNPYSYVDYTEEENSEAISSDVTLYAYWSRYREITFVAGGTSKIHKIYENIPFEIPDPGVPGMQVDAWFSSELLNTTPIQTITYNTPYDTFYAKLSIATYTITYTTKDGDLIPNDEYTIYDEITLPVLYKENYTFLGWCKTESLEDRPITKITIGNWGNLDLYAKFQGDDKTVVFDDGNGSMNAKNAVLEYGAGYTLPIPTYPGYAFTGWYLDEAGTVRLTDENGVSLKEWDILDESTTVYAKYQKKVFVTVSLSSPGAASYEIKPYYVVGEKVEIDIKVTEGYFYDGLFINDELITSSKKYSFIIGEENVAITLKFHRVGNITLKVDEAYAQYVSCAAMGKEGDTIYLNYKDADYGITAIFVNGAEVELNSDYSFVMPGGDTEVEVKFGPKRVYTIDTGDTGLEIYQFKGHYYAMVGRATTWEAAQAYCQFFGGNLVSVESEAERLFIDELRELKGYTGYGTWLGATDKDSEGTWKWLSGSTVNYSYFRSGEPNNGSGNENYAHIFAGANDWNDASGNESYVFICEWANKSQIKMPIVQTFNDADGNEQTLSIYEYNNHYYSIVPLSYTWENAERFAEFLGARLLALESEDEAHFINNLRHYIGLNGYNTWIGASDEITEGTWKWQNGAPLTYTNFANGQPDNSNNEDYLHLYGSGDTMLWNDANGASQMYFIMEWDSFVNIGSTLYGNFFNLIYSKEDFVKYILEAELTQNRDYTLMTSIDLSGVEWTAKNFEGTFNGGGNTIKNLSVTSNDQSVAVFLRVTQSIKNLNFENLTVKSNAINGVLVGGVCTELTGTLENVNVISGSITANASTAGGIVASLAGGNIINCKNGAAVSSTVNLNASYGTGGIVGYAYTGLISGCENSGDVTGGSFTGGILGSSNLHSGLTIENLKNSGKITGTADHTGGIAGYYSRPYTYNVSNMQNSGIINGTNYVGGIFGLYYNYNEDYGVETHVLTLSNLTNGGAIIASGDYVGGVFGYIYLNDYLNYYGSIYDGQQALIITETQNSASVTGRYYVGGIFGYGRTDAPSSEGHLLKSTGKITAEGYVGGIAGYLETVNLLNPDNLNTAFELKGAFTNGTTKFAYVGGYVGFLNNSNVSGAINRTEIDYSSTQCTGSCVGGIAGYSSGTIINSENHAKINAKNSSEVGGIAGKLDKPYTYSITNLKNTAEISGVSYVGGIFGYIYNANADYSVVAHTLSLQNFENTGTVTASGDYVGGIIGKVFTEDYLNYYGSIYDGCVILYVDSCKNTASVTGQYYVGGILGHATTDAGESTVTNTQNSGAVNATAIVGGIAGYTCYLNFESPSNEGTVLTVTGTYTDKRAWIGGYVGYAVASNIAGAVNDVEINYSTHLSLGIYVGGIVGETTGVLKNCTNNAVINAPKASYVGGIAGAVNKTYSYTSQNLTNTASVSGTDYVGGIIGSVRNENSDYSVEAITMTFDNYVNSGTVTASGNYVGGLIGYLRTYDYLDYYGSIYNGQITLYLENSKNTGDVTGTYYVGGIFGYAETDSYASTVTAVINKSSITATAVAGAIAGEVYLINFTSPTNENSSLTFTGNLTDSSGTKYAYIGGYIGHAIASNISGATNEIDIEYSSALCLGSFVGGIVGESSGILTDCVNNASINAPKSTYVGGIAGRVTTSGSYTSKNLTNSGKILGYSYVAGIIGSVYNANSDYDASTFTVNLTAYINSGDVQASENFAGGIIAHIYTNDYLNHYGSVYDGKITVYISASKNSASVNGKSYVGGLVGSIVTDSLDSMMFDCDVIGSSVEATDNYGSLVGYTENFKIEQ